MKQRQQQIMKQSSSFGQPKNCINGCGALIYFDKNSPTGHPNPDKWIPLEIKEGRRTDAAHICPKRSSSGHTLETVAAAKPGNLKIAESLFEVLADYIRLKNKELGI